MLKQDYVLLSSHHDRLPLHRGHPQQSHRTFWRSLFFVFSALILVGLLTRHSLSRFCHARLHHQGSSRRRAPSNTRNPAYIVEATNGAVASENEVCSQIGVDTLKLGGNAVDAIVSTTFCIGVMNMFSSGIGGGGFMTAAPAAANSTMYVNNPIASLIGGLAVGVPGELRGLQEAHKRWGSLPWSTLVHPSVEAAKGWRVPKELARRIHMPVFCDLMQDNSDWSSIFAPEGRLLEEGDIIRRTNLSRTLGTIAAEGPDAFYKGPIADAIVEKVRASGGILTHKDLTDYRVRVNRALQGTYRGRKIYTPHPPTSGLVLMHMLNLMEHYDDLTEEGRTLLNTHRYIEAMKFGFAARTEVSDPTSADDLDRMSEIPTKKFGQEIFGNITDAQTHSPEYYNPVYDVVVDHGTSHSSIVDKNGMAVALTSTVNLVFGSQVMDPITGVILNDEMDDFSTPGMPNAFGLYPSPYNYPEPGKRPLSSTTPTIMEHEDGSFYLAIGGSGGSKIFPAVFQVILNLDWGMDVSAAIEHGRLHDQLYPLEVEADSVYDPELLEGLKILGHNVTVSNINRVASVVQAVVKKGDTIYAASDSRKNGIAAGY